MVNIKKGNQMDIFQIIFTTLVTIIAWETIKRHSGKYDGEGVRES